MNTEQRDKLQKKLGITSSDEEKRGSVNDL